MIRGKIQKTWDRVAICCKAGHKRLFKRLHCRLEGSESDQGVA